MRRFVSSLIVIASACAGTCFASGIAGFTYATLDYSALRTRIAPGGSGHVEFVAHSAGGGTVYAEGIASEPARGLAEYRFVPLNPSCGAPHEAPVSGRAGIVFEVGPLAAGATVRCPYAVERSSDSRRDFAFELCARGVPCGSEVKLGTLPDLRLAVTREERPNLFRLTVTNDSASDVESAFVATHCFDPSPAAGDPFADVLDVEADVPGGCPIFEDLGTLCYRDDFVARAFAVGPIAAGASASCLVELVALRDEVPFERRTMIVQLAGDRDLGAFALLAGDGTAFDDEVFNDMGFLQFAAQDANVNAIPAGGAVPILLTLGVLGLGMRRLRRNRPGS